MSDDKMREKCGRLRELIDQYWDIGWSEGLDARNYDSKEGAAQDCRRNIEAAISDIENAQGQGGDDLQNAEREASELAWSLWRRRYREASPNFELCDSVAGVITQIDNMAAGLLQDLESAEAQLQRQGGDDVGEVELSDYITFRDEDGRRKAVKELSKDAIQSLPVGTKLYTAPQPQPAAPETDWIACSERLPTEADADCDGKVWALRPEKLAPLPKVTRVHWQDAVWSCPYWKPTGLKRPEPPEDT